MITLGDFRLTERVAQGGMAEVWRAIHEPTETLVALKLPSTRGGEVDPRLARALHHEARAMAALRSSRVVQVHDLGVVSAVQSRDSGGRLPEGGPWMAMEWVGGGTVDACVEGWADLQGALLDVLRALAHAHAHGIVHRDVKPANVLVELRRPLRVKLADFGIAFARRAWLESRGEAPASALTPLFSAPEQVARQMARQGPWTDLYQLGCLAWALACGEPPFAEAPDTRSVVRAHLHRPVPPMRPRFEVPGGFEAWVRQLMAKQPAERFGCAGDARAALLALDPEEDRRRRVPAAVAPTARIVGPLLATLRPPRLVGREPERARLDAALAQVEAHRVPRIVLVRGPSGIGTTAVVERWLEQAEVLGRIRAVRARELPGTGGLGELCARCLGVTVGDDLADAVDAALQIRPGAPPHAGALVTLVDGSLHDRAERFEVAAATLRWLADRPVILWIDPPHAQGELVAFAAWLARTRPGLPLLIVISASDELLAEHGAMEALSDLTADVVALGPLEPTAILALIEDLASLDTASAARIAGRSEGNPAMAVELVRERVLRARSLAVQGVTGDDDEPSAGPHPVADLDRSSASRNADPGRWDARHAALIDRSPAVGPALEVAAVLGATVDHEEWAAVCAALRVPLDLPTVATLQAELVLTEDGPAAYRFLQPGFRLSVLRRLGAEAARIHRAAADVLQLRGADPDRIGAHRKDGGDPDGAFVLLIQGARLAGFRGDYVRAQVALDHAARGLADDDPRLSEVLGSRIERARTAGATEEALRHVRHLLRLARTNDSAPSLRKALLQRGTLRVDDGDPGGIEDTRRAMELSGLGQTWAEAACWHALLLGQIGRSAEAEALLHEARQQWPSEYLALYGLGCVHLDQQRPLDALARLDEMLAVVAGRDDRLNEALGWAMRSHALRVLGRLDEAEQLAVRAEGRLVELRSGFAWEARLALGLARLALGRAEEARTPFVRALVEAERPRRAATAALAVVAARTGVDDPVRWLEAFDPEGLWVSLLVERELAALLESLADHKEARAAVMARFKAQATRQRLAPTSPPPARP